MKNACCLRCLNDICPKQGYHRLFIRRKVFLMNYALCADCSDMRDSSFPGITLLKHTLGSELDVSLSHLFQFSAQYLRAFNWNSSGKHLKGSQLHGQGRIFLMAVPCALGVPFVSQLLQTWNWTVFFLSLHFFVVPFPKANLENSSAGKQNRSTSERYDEYLDVIRQTSVSKQRRFGLLFVVKVVLKLSFLAGHWIPNKAMTPVVGLAKEIPGAVCVQ